MPGRQGAFSLLPLSTHVLTYKMGPHMLDSPQTLTFHQRQRPSKAKATACAIRGPPFSQQCQHTTPLGTLTALQQWVRGLARRKVPWNYRHDSQAPSAEVPCPPSARTRHPHKLPVRERLSSSLPAQGTMGLHSRPLRRGLTQGEVQGPEVTGHNDEAAPPGLETPTF